MFPNRGLLPRQRLLQCRKKQNADTIAFASCIQKGTPIGYPCPFHKRMKDLLTAGLPENIRILDYTHDAPGDKK